MKVYLPILVLITFLITSCSASKNAVKMNRDGSSFEKAVIVKNVSEEYKFAKKNCTNCEFIAQYLLFENKKPFDLLEYKNLKGETINFYFDISEFFGKY